MFFKRGTPCGYSMIAGIHSLACDRWPRDRLSFFSDIQKAEMIQAHQHQSQMHCTDL